MRKISAGLIALVGVGVMAGCTTNNTVGNPKFTTHAKLQLAVGTLNDAFGTLTSESGVYLNAVSTFRNQFGQSAFINPGTPTFSLPGGGSATVCGLFSYGQNPLTMINPFLVQPPGNPVGPIGALAPAFGEPPAFNPGNANGIGYALGYLVYLNAGDADNGPCTLYVLPPAPAPGSYTLSTTVAVNGRHVPFSATATLGSAPTVLPAEPTPVYAPGAAGSGGGTFTIVNPAGVTEALVYIVDTSTGADISVEASGTSAVVPAGTLTPGDTFQAFVIGSDYPLFESSPPGNTAQAPTIVGAGGTADITVSDATPVFTQP